MHDERQVIFLKVNNVAAFENFKSDIRTKFDGFIRGDLQSCGADFLTQSNFKGKTHRNFFYRIFVKSQARTVYRTASVRLQIIFPLRLHRRKKFFIQGDKFFAKQSRDTRFHIGTTDCPS